MLASICRDRKSTRLNSSHTVISYAVFCLNKKKVYPTDFLGQLYIPQINWLLMAGCIFIVLYFHESKYMEAAYGLSVTLTIFINNASTTEIYPLTLLHALPI